MHLTEEEATTQPETDTMDVKESSVLDLTLEKNGGVLKEIIRDGEGDEHPGTGDKVKVHYVGTLQEDGSQFDSSRDRGDHFQFTLGKGEVIKAWDIGVASMRRGELCRLTCKSEYAYGDSGSPPKIPPGATLVFEVELFSWESGEDLSKDKNGGIMKLSPMGGEGFKTPNEQAWVKVDIKGKIQGGDVFDERVVEFNLDEASEADIPSGLEVAIGKMKKNETCTIKLKPEYGFHFEGHAKFGVPANASLEYLVTLHDFESAKETWEMSQEEKIDQAKVHKEKGTKYFKEEKYKAAEKQYEKITTLLSYDSGLDDEKKLENHSLKLAGELNLAATYLKLKDYAKAKLCASKAVEQDPDNVKGYFRRGQAQQYMDEFEAAMSDYRKVLALDPNNGAAKKQLHAVSEQLKQHRQREKQIYSGMFEKFATADANRATTSKKSTVLKDGLGEWDDKNKKNEEKDEDLSAVKLLSSGDQIKGEEFMSTT